MNLEKRARLPFLVAFILSSALFVGTRIAGYFENADHTQVARTDRPSPPLNRPAGDKKEKEVSAVTGKPRIQYYGALMIVSIDPSAIAREKETWAMVPLQEVLSAGITVDGIFSAQGFGVDFKKDLKKIESLGWAAGPKLREIFVDRTQAWKKRYFAATALGRVGGVEAKRALMSGLKDGLSVIRMASLIALKNFSDGDVIDAIHDIFLNDNAMLVRSTAVDVIAEIGYPGSVDVLAAGLNNEGNFYRGRNLWIRNSIVRAIGRLKSKRSVPCLIDILSAGDKDLAQDALLSLESMVAEPGLAKISPKESVKDRVAWWLEWWGKNKSKFF